MAYTSHRPSYALQSLRRTILLSFLAAALGALGMIPVAHADSVFHTKRIPLMPVNGAPLQNGAVVDIHANGPVIYAHENYILNGVLPDITYTVQSLIYAGGTNCTALLFTLPDATLLTNAAGNAEGDNVITPTQVGALRGSRLDIIWQVVGPSGVAYQTPCVSVPLD